MVEIKQAVSNAIAFATETLGTERTLDIRLEEIESSEASGIPVWLITLSNVLIRPQDGPLARIRVGSGVVTGMEREYKVFAVAKSNGNVLSMKIRQVAVSE